jgi:SNF2 family DNA or RNA helicase
MFVDTQYDRVFLKLKDTSALQLAIPDMIEEVSWKGHNIAVEHNLDSTKVLRNLGIKVPSPIKHKYGFPCPPHITAPFAHQIVTSEFLTLHRKGFVLNEMGTSKTASVLWAADYLMREREVQRALIVAPLSTLNIVWRDEIFNFIMHRTAVVLYGNAERRLELLDKRADFYIINYEGLPTIQRALRKRDDIDLLIVDEVAAYRNGNTERYKTLEEILDRRPRNSRRWFLTGTPCPNAPTDAWALARLVNKARVPMYFSTWKQKTMQKRTTHKWVPREGSKEMAFEVLQPAVRFAKKDCLDLPPVTFEARECAMTPEQKKAFDMMRQHMVTFAEEYEIDAVNAADKIGKLRQILLGALKHPETGEYIVLPHKPRLNVLLELIEQASAKVLVIVPYKGIARALKKEVGAHYSTELVNGDVTPKQRLEIFRRFKQEKHPHTLLCHPRVMAHGLTLTEADMLVFYGPIDSNEQNQQVMERINRPGQKRNMTIARIGANAMEWEMYRRVEGQRMEQEGMLELYQQILQS